MSFFQAVRLLGSGLGSALFVILWHRRQEFYHDRLGSRLTQFSQITNQFLERAQLFHVQGQQAYAQLDFYLNRQATVLALEDCFYLMGWLLIFLLLIVLLSFLLEPPVLFDNRNTSTFSHDPPLDFKKLSKPT